MSSTDSGVAGDEPTPSESRGRAALLAVGAAAARAEPYLPTALRRSLARRFLVALVGFAVVVPAAALTLPTTAASVGAVVAAGVLLGTVGFCEVYYVLVGTERRLAELRADEKEPKPGACVRLDEGGDLVDAVETAVDDYERRLADAAAERERLTERNADLERAVAAWSDEATETLRAVADGDLDRRLAAEDAPEPLAAVSAAVDDALGELEETLFNVESFATEADRAGIEATETADAVADHAGTVADRADTVAERLDRQQRDVERAAGTAADLSAGFDDLEAAADDAAAGVESVADAVEAAADTAASADGALAAASTDRARAEADRARARADDVADHLDAVAELADRVGLLALNATLHAARAEKRGIAGAERFRTLAGEALVLAEATEDRTAACRTALEDVRAGADAVGETLATTDARIEAASERVTALAGDIETVRARTDAAAADVDTVARRVDRYATPAAHVAGVTDRVVDRNERTAERADALLAETDALRDEAAALLDELGTVRSQAGFLQVQTEGVTTRDVDAVRTPQSAATDD